MLRWKRQLFLAATCNLPPPSSSNPSYGVIALFKDFREFEANAIQKWVDDWLKLGPIMVQKISLIFKEWREERALRDYKFAETTIWMRVEGLPVSVDQTKLALNILERVGVCIYVDKDNDQETPQSSTRV
ncbi:Phosphoglucosamine mutase [Bienertia sinuspersici]